MQITLTRLAKGAYITKDKRYRITNLNHLGMPLGHWQVWTDRGQLVSEHPTLADARADVAGNYAPATADDTPPRPWHPVNNMTAKDAEYVAAALPYLVSRPYMREWHHYTRCQDCDRTPHTGSTAHAHLLINGVVVIGCEGYHQLHGELLREDERGS